MLPVGPIFFATQLIANLVVFMSILGLESFSREMRIGTYVIVVSVVLLIYNGPESQDYGDASFQELMRNGFAVVWALLLTLSMIVTGFILSFFDIKDRGLLFKFATLLIARASAFSLNLTTGKALVIDISPAWLAVNIAIKILSGMIYTNAIVVQSTTVEQRVFVPLNAVTIIFVNAITGIAIWKDGQTIQSWVGYICVFLLLSLGCCLLLGDLNLFHETAPHLFLGKAKIFNKKERKKLLQDLKQFKTISVADLENLSISGNDDLEEGQENGTESEEPLDRRSSWRNSMSRKDVSSFKKSTRSKAAWSLVYDHVHTKKAVSDDNGIIAWKSLRQGLAVDISNRSEDNVDPKLPLKDVKQENNKAQNASDSLPLIKRLSLVVEGEEDEEDEEEVVKP